MATVRLVGSATDGTNFTGADYFTLGKFTAIATGTLSEIKIYALASGNVKVAIYADNAGEPGALIVANNTGQAVTLNQWNTLTIGSAQITQGTVYWIACNADTSGAITRNTGAGTQRYKVATYSGFTFPDPAGSDFTNQVYEYARAGWGVQVVAPSGIAQAIALGTPKLNFNIVLSGIAQAIAYGTPTVSTAGLSIQVPGIAQVIALGTPTLIKLLQIIYPSGIAQPIALGSPKLNFIIKPTGIAQAVAIGTPAIILYKCLKPDAAGDYTNLSTQYPASGAHWDKVDDPVGSPDDLSTYVQNFYGSYVWDAYNIEPFSEGVTIDVKSVTVYFRCRNQNSTYPSYAKPGLRLNSQETLGTAVTLSDTDWHTGSEALSRPSGGNWAQADLADLQVLIGLLSGTGDGVICTQVYVRVAYVVTGVVQTISPSGIEQLIAIGTPTVVEMLQIIYAAGISQAVAFGTLNIGLHRLLAPTRILNATRVQDATRIITRSREQEL